MILGQKIQYASKNHNLTHLDMYNGWDYLKFIVWLSGRVLDLSPRSCGLDPYLGHCSVSLSKTH